MAIWRKENGGWKILADQVTPIINREIDRPIISNPPDYHQFEGVFKLSTTPSILIQLQVVHDTLRLIISEKLEEGLKFFPTFNNTFYAKERPWVIKYHTRDSVTLNSWGQLSKGKRIE